MHDTTHVEKAATIDELPLEWFFGDGAKLDMNHKVEGDPMTVEEIRREPTRNHCSFKPMNIVLACTGRDR